MNQTKYFKIFFSALTVAGSIVFFVRFGSAAPSYEIDPAHSSVAFAVQHLMVSETKGGFGDFQGTIEFEPTGTDNSAEVTIKAQSINTNQAKRDEHLRSADFLDAAKYQEITFKSKKFEGSNGNYNMTGDLTLHGVTKEISFPVKIMGPAKTPMGGTVIGLNADTTINRQDFGVTWNKNLDNGGYVVGNDVKISISMEALMKDSAQDKAAEDKKS